MEPEEFKMRAAIQQALAPIFGLGSEELKEFAAFVHERTGVSVADFNLLGSSAAPGVQHLVGQFMEVVNNRLSEADLNVHAVQEFLPNARVTSNPNSDIGEQNDLTVDVGATVGATVAQTTAAVVIREQLQAQGMPEWAIRTHVDNGGFRSRADIDRLIEQDVARSYGKPRILGGFGASPLEFYRNPVGNQSFISRRQARTLGGVGRQSGFGRAINDDLKNDLERVLKASIKENYHREIPTDREVNTGVLLQAIEQASFNVNDVLSFTYELRDLPGEARPGRAETEQRPSVHKYAPLVFQGRQSINVSESIMVFKGRFGWRRSQTVAPAEPRPVLTLTSEQLERIDVVIQKGVTPEVEEWLSNVDALV